MLNRFNILKSLPVQLVFCLLVGLVFGAHIPLEIANILYTLSCFIKDVLMYALPFVIFTYLWAAIAAFGNKGFILVILTFGLIIAANACTVLTAYAFGLMILPAIVDGSIIKLTMDGSTTVTCLWSIPDWQYIKPVHGMLGGVFLVF